MSTTLTLDLLDEIEARPATLFDDADDLPFRESARPHSGCLGLLAAIIEDLFVTKRGLSRRNASGFYGSVQRQRSKDAEWVGDESEDPFSFRWVCLHLNINADDVRRRYEHER